MQEYATTVKSSDVGLTWETHFKAKKQFEVTSLKRIFKFCVQVLSELMKSDIQEPMLPLVRHLLSICEGVLTWGFIYVSYILFILVQLLLLLYNENPISYLSLTPVHCQKD